MAEILIVDDERTVRAGLRALLRGEGYAVRTARRADEALAAFTEKRPDLVLLDVMMPGRNGFAVCEEIRRVDALVPIVFLTAKEGEVDHVRAYGIGADDYVHKAASEAELLARLRRALERATMYRASAVDARTALLGGITVDFDALTLTGDGIDDRLTKMEADLLWLLVAARGRVCTYDDIFDVLHGGDVTTFVALQAHVSRLKRKLGDRAGGLIVNERAVGYRLMG